MTERQEEMLDELLEKDCGMNGREVDFIDDLDRSHRSRDLSEKQVDWLVSIWTRVCN